MASSALRRACAVSVAVAALSPVRVASDAWQSSLQYVAADFQYWAAWVNLATWRRSRSSAAFSCARRRHSSSRDGPSPSISSTMLCPFGLRARPFCELLLNSGQRPAPASSAARRHTSWNASKIGLISLLQRHAAGQRPLDGGVQGYPLPALA